MSKERGQSCLEESNTPTTTASVSPVRESLSGSPGCLLVSLDSGPRHGHVKHASILKESPGVLLGREIQGSPRLDIEGVFVSPRRKSNSSDKDNIIAALFQKFLLWEGDWLANWPLQLRKYIKTLIVPRHVAREREDRDLSTLPCPWGPRCEGCLA